MPKRWVIATVVISAALTASCSSAKTTTAPSSPAGSHKTPAAASGETNAAETAPAAPLESSRCMDVTGADVDLLAASDKEAARKAADALENYNPPAMVKNSIEHFVTTGGGHFDDPDYAKNHKILDKWVKEICPT
jgi:hypothetical protein